jgi:hypothetical protein
LCEKICAVDKIVVVAAYTIQTACFDASSVPVGSMMMMMMIIVIIIMWARIAYSV